MAGSSGGLNGGEGAFTPFTFLMRGEKAALRGPTVIPYPITGAGHTIPFWSEFLKSTAITFYPSLLRTFAFLL